VYFAVFLLNFESILYFGIISTLTHINCIVFNVWSKLVQL